MVVWSLSFPSFWLHRIMMLTFIRRPYMTCQLIHTTNRVKCSTWLIFWKLCSIVRSQKNGLRSFCVTQFIAISACRRLLQQWFFIVMFFMVDFVQKNCTWTLHNHLWIPVTSLANVLNLKLLYWAVNCSGRYSMWALIMY